MYRHSRGVNEMTKEKLSRLIEQIEVQHHALCLDYRQLRNLLDGVGGDEEGKLEKIADMYWQLRSQMSDIAHAKPADIDFR